MDLASLVDSWRVQLEAERKSASTARARQLALRRFSAWLVEEGELPTDPLAGLRPPKLGQKIVPVLSEEEIRRLLKACEGKGLRDRRDEAIIRLLLETGLRAGECVALRVEDVDVRGGLVLVRRSKGGKGRVVPFGPVTGRAVDRYLRLRLRRFALRADQPGQGRRAGAVLPHVLRHTFAIGGWLPRAAR